MEGAPCVDIASTVDYLGGQEVAGTHTGFTNVVTNVPPVPVDEVIYGAWLSKNCRERMV